ncbi:MAG: type II toxin-antitoxin system RelE/ParE family toxin [Anaerolineae bacterium]|nr:type II toxin-antitoxin system RelE/ParE family toxin [Anaerolineae bacterium]
MYRIEVSSTRIKRELRAISDADRQRVIAAIASLKEVARPSGIVQLIPNVYRLRVGNYRIIYKVFDAESLILIGRISRRNEKTYRDIDNLFD